MTFSFFLYGWSDALYEANKTRDLLVILEEPLSLPESVNKMVIETPLQVELFTCHLASQRVFQQVVWLEGGGPKEYFSFFKDRFEYYHLQADLLLSDAADFGIKAAGCSYAHRKKKCHSIFALDGAFSNIPAVIAGAGPSLCSLKPYEGKALIFAGGTALKKIDVEPHFAAGIDSEPLKHTLLTSPFCFQSRVHPETLRSIRGPLFRAPESHFAFLRWIEEETRNWDTGWTVGNFMTALAVLCGCNPIVFVGMDFCYRQNQKYAGDVVDTGCDACLRTLNRHQEEVKTQKDWLMAVKWMDEFTQKHPEISFIDACGEGLDLGKAVRVDKTFSFKHRLDINGSFQKVFACLPPPQSTEKKWEEWILALQSQSFLAEELLLTPLWNVWKPIFERQTLDSQALEIHRSLFFETLLKEHLHARQ